MSTHSWPTDDSCMFGAWHHQTGLPNPTQYRCCIHPGCFEVEIRDTPRV